MNEDMITENTKLVSLLWVVVAIAAQVIVFGVIYYTAPQFEATYEMTMPGRALYQVTVMFFNINPVWFLVVMATNILALLAKEIFIRQGSIRNRISIALTLTAGTVLLIYIIAVFKPLVEYRGGLGG